MSFNQQLAAFRKAKGISQEALADMLGVSRQAVSKWETGETQPEMANLMALCDILEVSPNKLMGYGDAELPKNEREETSKIRNKNSRLKYFIAVILIAAALVAGIFIGKTMVASDQPASPLEGKENIEITGFLYDFNPSGRGGEIKLTVMPGIADESLTYEIIRMGDGGGDKSYTVVYKDGICTAYVETVTYSEVVYTLRVSDGENIINKPLFKVYAHNDNHWSHEELWNN